MLATLHRLHDLRRRLHEALRCYGQALNQVMHRPLGQTRTWSRATRLDLRVWPDGRIDERRHA